MGAYLSDERREDLELQSVSRGGIVWDMLDAALADAMVDPLERSLLPAEEVARLRAAGCESAGQAALWRIRDSVDPAHNARFLALLVQSLPKRKETRRVNIDLKDMSLSELLSASGIDLREVEVTDVRYRDTSEDTSDS
jgi:hypothetical protein